MNFLITIYKNACLLLYSEGSDKILFKWTEKKKFRGLVIIEWHPYNLFILFLLRNNCLGPKVRSVL